MRFAKTLRLLIELGVFYYVDSEFQIKLWEHGSKTRKKYDLPFSDLSKTWIFRRKVYKSSVGMHFIILKSFISSELFCFTIVSLTFSYLNRVSSSKLNAISFAKKTWLGREKTFHPKYTVLPYAGLPL